MGYAKAVVGTVFNLNFKSKNSDNQSLNFKRFILKVNQLKNNSGVS